MDNLGSFDVGCISTQFTFAILSRGNMVHLDRCAGNTGSSIGGYDVCYSGRDRTVKALLTRHPQVWYNTGPHKEGGGKGEIIITGHNKRFYLGGLMYKKKGIGWFMFFAGGGWVLLVLLASLVINWF